MAFFKDRHNLRSDYSGYQEVSEPLRKKVAGIIREYADSNVYGGYSTEKPSSFHPEDLEQKMLIIEGSPDVYGAIKDGEFYEVFQVIEIFFDLAELELNSDSYKRALIDMMQAFHYSGSVYKINDEGKVELKTDEELNKKIEGAKKILEENTDAYNLFMSSISSFLKRKDSPSQLIGNLYIVAEKFLNTKTGKKDLGEAIKKLEKTGILANVQSRSFLTAIEGYASGSQETRHPGSDKIPKPDEINALWYLGIFSTYIMLIDQKLKQAKDT